MARPLKNLVFSIIDFPEFLVTVSADLVEPRLNPFNTGKKCPVCDGSYKLMAYSPPDPCCLTCQKNKDNDHEPFYPNPKPKENH